MRRLLTTILLCCLLTSCAHRPPDLRTAEEALRLAELYHRASCEGPDPCLSPAVCIGLWASLEATRASLQEAQK